jgi:hypothetical protein
MLEESFTELQLDIMNTYSLLKQIRRSISKLRVEEDSLSNKLERLMQLSETQMKITFEDEQERDNGDASV